MSVSAAMAHVSHLRLVGSGADGGRTPSPLGMSVGSHIDDVFQLTREHPEGVNHVGEMLENAEQTNTASKP